MADVLAGWRRAEERLYPLVMVDPDRYRRMVSVIRATADRLGGEQTVEELVATRQRGRELVSLSCADVGVPTGELGDIDAVADAAFGLRHGELVVEQHRRRTAERIEAARARGDGWVMLDESGHRDEPAVAPYQRIDMRLDDGHGVRMAVDVDPGSYRPIYSVEPLRLDPETGALAEEPDPAGAATFTDPAPWQAAAARMRSDGPERAGGLDIA